MRDAAGMMTYEYTYYCCDCRSPMALVAGKRPTFNCSACPSNGGRSKRNVRAFTSVKGKDTVAVAEALGYQKGGQPLPGAESDSESTHYEAESKVGSDSDAEEAPKKAVGFVQYKRDRSTVNMPCSSSVPSKLGGWNGNRYPRSGLKRQHRSMDEMQHRSEQEMHAFTSLSMLAAAGHQLERMMSPREAFTSRSGSGGEQSKHVPGGSRAGGAGAPDRPCPSGASLDECGRSVGGWTTTNSTMRNSTSCSSIGNDSEAGGDLGVLAVGAGLARREYTEEEREAKRQRRIQANRESARNTIRRKKELHENLASRARHLEEENRSLQKKRDELLHAYQVLQMEVNCLRGEHEKIIERVEGSAAAVNADVKPIVAAANDAAAVGPPPTEAPANTDVTSAVPCEIPATTAVPPPRVPPSQPTARMPFPTSSATSAPPHPHPGAPPTMPMGSVPPMMWPMLGTSPHGHPPPEWKGMMPPPFPMPAFPGHPPDPTSMQQLMAAQHEGSSMSLKAGTAGFCHPAHPPCGMLPPGMMPPPEMMPPGHFPGAWLPHLPLGMMMPGYASMFRPPAPAEGATVPV